MKHIITAILLALAVAAGLLLPEVFMDWQDRELETPRLVSVTEPTLEWDPSKAQDVAEAEVISEDIAHRLMLFEAGPGVTVPVSPVSAEEMEWAANLALEFLNMLCETAPVIDHAGVEYQLAWFENGTTIPYWEAFVRFNDTWVCMITIDAETGAILQVMLNPNGADLAELFPESFVRYATETELSFEGLVSQRFCDTLGWFMGRNDGGVNPVIPSIETGSAFVTFPDAPELRVETFFVVDLIGGIHFNDPAAYG